MDSTAAPKLTFSLRHLLLAFAFVAVGCASLLWANWPILAVWRLVVGASFFAAAIVAIFDRGAWRAFAIGYLIVAVTYNANARVGQRLNQMVGGGSMAMGTEPLLSALWPIATREQYRVSATDDWSSVRPSGAGVIMRYFPDSGSFQLVGVEIFSIVFGCIGGWFAAFVLRRRKARAA